MSLTHDQVCKVTVFVEAPSAVTMQNVFYWQLKDPEGVNPSNAQVMEAVRLGLIDIYTPVIARMPTDYEVDRFSVDKVSWIAGKWEVVETIGTGVLNLPGGHLTSDALPHGVSGVVTAYTHRPQTRARKFLGGLAELDVTDSTLSGTLLTALTLFATEWLTDLVIYGSTLLTSVVLGQSGTSSGLIYPLVSAAVSAIAGYQRRRKPGVGS